MKDKKTDRKQRFSLTLTFSLVVFTILLGAISIAAVTVALLVRFKLIGGAESLKVSDVIIFMALISTVLGTVITFLVLKFPLRPINTLINKMNSLAKGRYDTRLEYKGLVAAVPGFNELSESFNTLACELGSTEMLRSDFINNFSHEFKTPIVSITGLARLLGNADLTEAEKKQYIAAIEEESLRLSAMATNVMSLTKIENQTILGGISRFNLSEQLRSCLLLLENKWSKKNIELAIELEEYTVEACEELCRQVWINLLDNAIKFSPVGATVTVDVTESSDSLTVLVSNTGSEIPKDKISRIWNKFYQADESHSGEGNGVGLAIVKRITELHGGKVGVESGNGVTSFTVTLPKTQRK